jgi:hypothetical protein
MPRFPIVRPAALALCLLALSQAAWTQTARPAAGRAPDLAAAESLLRAGKAADAWNALAPHEADFAGEEDYDYLLGVAALDSGRANLATLAFERVLAVNPNHAAARLDMGRAYYELGDFDRARAEFASVLANDAPQAARDTIARYVAAMDTRVARGGGSRGLRASGYLEASFGRDGNVNASTANSQLYLPLFGANFTLGSTSTRKADQFLTAGGGGEVLYGIAGGLSAVAGGDIRQRSNYKQDTFDSRSTDMRLGLQHESERDWVRVSVAKNDYDLDNSQYRTTPSLSAEWRRLVTAGSLLSGYVQDSRMRYVQPAARSNSADLFVYGLGGTHTVDEASRTVAFASAQRGSERATDGRADGDRRLYGLRGGVQRALRGDADWYASVGWQKSTYEAVNAVFQELRKDWQYDLTAGVSWQAREGWLVRPQFSYTRSDSKLPLYDYDRYELSVTLRRDFR